MSGEPVENIFFSFFLGKLNVLKFFHQIRSRFQIFGGDLWKRGAVKLALKHGDLLNWLLELSMEIVICVLLPIS